MIMQTKISLKWSLFVIGMAVIIFSIIIFLFLVSINNIQLYIPLQLQRKAEVPLRLRIPSLNIDAPIEEVSLTADGLMGVPKLPEDVAWFNPGPLPGEIGSSVIDGHSGYKNNVPAVFDSLDKLKKGDEIYVKNNKGATTAFVVRDLKNYEPSIYPSSIFSSNDGLAHLNLITCSGLWNAIDQTHSLRLIVFTDKE
jgi:LPXTG-site transpeptidase (sortase) family protein